MNTLKRQYGFSREDKIAKLRDRYEWDDCLCGGTDELRKELNPNKTYHSHSCKLNHRHNSIIRHKQKKREEKIVKHICLDCSNKVDKKEDGEYYIRCPKCRERIHEYEIRRKEKQIYQEILIQELNSHYDTKKEGVEVIYTDERGLDNLKRSD